MRGDYADLAARVAARIVSAGLYAATIFAAAQQMNPQQFAVLGSLLGVGLFTNALGGFGTTQFALTISESDVSLLGEAVALRIFGLAAGLALLLAMSMSLDASGDVVIAALALTASDNLNDLLQGVASGRQRHTQASINLVWSRSFQLTFVLGSAIAFGSTEAGLVAACSVTALGAMLQMPRPRLKRNRIAAVIAEVRGYWLTGASAPLFNLLPYCLTFVVGPAAVGATALALRFTTPLNLVTSSLAYIFVPRMANPKDRRAARRQLYGVAVSWGALLTLLSIPMAIVAEDILGNEYSGLKWIVWGAVIGAAVSSVNQALQADLFVKGRAGEAGTSVLVGSSAGLVLGVVLGWWADVSGIAVALVAAQLTMGVMMKNALRPSKET